MKNACRSWIQRSILICAPLLAFCTPISGQQLLPFQGRLTDAGGKPIADGVRLAQFQIYNEPISGSVLWAGEIHRTTVNGGLVNVLLGAKNPLPRDRSDQPDKSFFDQPLYLQVTLDADSDNQITANDPPLLPRQILVPVIFAQESSNARKLQGFDWSSLFGSNNPTGKILGSRIADGTITAAQMATNTITGLHIAEGAISASQLAPGAVLARNLGTGIVTLTNLAPREVGTNVPAGGVARSEPFSGPLVVGKITRLSVQIASTGRPVWISLVADSSSEQPASIYVQRGNVTVLTLHARTAGTTGERKVGSYSWFGPNEPFGTPPSVSYLDFAASGQQTYEIGVSGNPNGDLANVRLVAFEL